ncbi:transglutaminase-like domain-containing protein [Cerasicoccus fimbriatus]|uniref:transglutaminase-like domain-containing protein n=1 Tax=Cerasicoccus fimbriatus TaxID=3014554 RepID=UPI0022B2F286|nr:transglutaminase family protein [Cerasicoccus sp. TK19100]
MEILPSIHRPDLDLSVRIGCEIVYEASVPTPALITIKPRQAAHQAIRQESTTFEPILQATEFEDDHENIVYRIILQPGTNTLRYDAIATVPGFREDFAWVDDPYPPHLLPASVLRYTMPSRYCDSDKLMNFAWQQFGHVPHGLARINAICYWINQNIEYRTGSGSPNISAYDVIQRGFGVCRDLAHCAVALCRTFNLPARYVSGFVPDIGCIDPGTPMDFHAYLEVYMGGRWQTFDARFLGPRTGRVRICAGYDAVNCAFSTLYGAVNLTQFNVWSYQIDPSQVKVGDPIDLTKRLCGTDEIRRPAKTMTYNQDINYGFGYRQDGV